MTDTRTRILDAAFQSMTRHGLARLSLEDVAREAGLSRQTVYRYFGTRDALLSAAVLREEEGFIARISAAADEHEDVRPRLEAALREALTAAREHPLLDRLLATEPEALLPLLTTGAGPVLAAARPVLEDIIAQRLAHLSPSQIRRAADAITRLIISYAINPGDDPLDEVAAGLADLIVDGVKH
jgi:AcrR family transcriptional regulator